MIVVAVNDEYSFESIERWRAEIQQIEPYKPIFLILSKIDLAI